MSKKVAFTSAVVAMMLIVRSVVWGELPAGGSPQSQPSAYVLGPSDTITIQAMDVEELSNKPIWIDTGGFINLPLIGRVKVAGLTVQELEAALNVQLKRFVKAPHVIVAVSEFRSQPVSVIGYVNTPGVLQVQGRKTLLEVLSQAGGLKPDAGAVAKITRRLEYGEIPLPGATTDASGQFGVAELQLRALMDGKNPEHNILIRPHDVVSVPKADILYVIGAVKKSGGFVLADRRRTSVIEAVALAEGILPEANRKKAELLRLEPGKDERVKIELKLDKILSGKETDIALQAEDILIISPSAIKSIKRKIGETALAVATSAAIYGGF